MKKILSIALIFTLCTQAHAGIWDSLTSFFGGDEADIPTAEVQASPPESAKVTDQATSQDNSLVKTGLQLLPLLMQTLNVSDGQAKGGMGAILQAAQVLLSQTEYGALLGAIPGSQSFISAAPPVTQQKKSGDLKGQLIQGALNAASNQGGALKQGADLVSQFDSLGLGADMIPKFSGVANDYLKAGNSPETAALLTSALSQLGGLSL